MCNEAETRSLCSIITGLHVLTEIEKEEKKGIHAEKGKKRDKRKVVREILDIGGTGDLSL